MSKNFTVYPEKLKSNTENFDKVYSDLYRKIEQIRSLESEVKNNSLYYSIAANLRNVISEGENQTQSLNNLKKALQDIISLYEKAENNIIGETGIITSPEIGTGVDNGTGSGGGRTAKDESGTSQRPGQGTEENEGIGDYLLETLLQIIGGDFVDDGNLLGTIINVILGFVPVVGQIADVRDLIASIYKLIDDGAETVEWVNLGLNLIAFIPGVGDFVKNSDKLAPILKNVDEFVDGLGAIGDATKGIIKKGDEVVSAIGDVVDEFKQTFDEKVIAKIINKLDDITGDSVDVKKTVETIADTLAEQINKDGDDVGDFVENLAKEITGFDDAVNEFIADGIDRIEEGINSAFDNVKDIGNALFCKDDFFCMAVA